MRWLWLFFLALFLGGPSAIALFMAACACVSETPPDDEAALPAERSRRRAVVPAAPTRGAVSPVRPVFPWSDDQAAASTPARDDTVGRDQFSEERRRALHSQQKGAVK